jgi:hypothetical protein
MALRIARGLFRLWPVLSVLWIGGVAVETWWTFPVKEWVSLPSELPVPPWEFVGIQARRGPPLSHLVWRRPSTRTTGLRVGAWVSTGLGVPGLSVRRRPPSFQLRQQLLRFRLR